MSASHAGFERLLALERGLKSSLRTEQQKAILSIPSYLDDFKGLPEVIESCVLRIIDFFKVRSMERKVDMVCQLEKLKSDLDTASCNGDEISRRLNQLWDINDSFLRAQILRWYRLLHGCCLSGCKIEIWYRIGRSLLADIREEFVEAIETAIIFASPDFCDGIAYAALSRICQLPTGSALGVRLLKALLENVSRFEEIVMTYQVTRDIVEKITVDAQHCQNLTECFQEFREKHPILNEYNN